MACRRADGFRILREEIVGGYLALHVSCKRVSRQVVRGDDGYVDGAFGAGCKAKVVHYVPYVCVGFFCDAVLLRGVFHLAEVDGLVSPVDKQVNLGPTDYASLSNPNLLNVDYVARLSN